MPANECSINTQQLEQLDINKGKSDAIFFLFTVWTFFLLCRPQDYISFLALLRPTFVLGLITLFFFFLNDKCHWNMSSSNQFFLYGCFVVLLVIGVPFSYYRSDSLKQVFYYSSVGTLFFVMFYQLIDTTKRLLYLLFIYCCGVSVYGIFILSFGHLTEERVSFGTMFDPNDIAFFLINFFGFNFLFISKDKVFTARIVGAINMILSLIVIFKTGSRGGLVAFLAVLFYLLIVKTKTVKISFFKKIILILLTSMCMLTFSVNQERYKTILDVNDYNYTDETGRLAIWKIGMRLMFSNPLTGIGMGRFSEGVGRDREERGLPSAKWQAPHNSFIQVGAEIGLIGLILFTLITLKVFKITGQVIAVSKSEDLIKISEMVRAGFLGHFVGAMFLSQAYSVYWIFYIALSAVLHRMLKEEQA